MLAHLTEVITRYVPENSLILRNTKKTRVLRLPPEAAPIKKTVTDINRPNEYVFELNDLNVSIKTTKYRRNAPAQKEYFFRQRIFHIQARQCSLRHDASSVGQGILEKQGIVEKYHDVDLCEAFKVDDLRDVRGYHNLKEQKYFDARQLQDLTGHFLCRWSRSQCTCEN